MPKQEDLSRPVILYVERVEMNPDLAEYFHTQRVAVIDVEIDQIKAKEIMEYLTERLDGKLPGPVHLRLIGRLVHL